MTKRTRIASIQMGDINALNQWISNPQNPIELRGILGNIMSSMNSLSDVLRLGTVAPGEPEVAERARAILPDVANIENLKSSIAIAIPKIQQIQQNPQSPDTDKLKNVLLRMAHAIQLSQTTPQQIARLQQIASGTEAPGVLGETDQIRMRDFLKNSIYSARDQATKTNRVIREILQNSSDAALKRNELDPSVQPEIKLTIWRHPDGKFVDLVAQDNGIGMDWDTLSKKFFRYFATGKKGEKATGGYGIAKALIQETPEHGWAIESNGLHASKFDRNMWFATDNAHVPPQPQMEVSKSGTSISLFGLPNIDDYDVRAICKYYAMGTVKIVYNGTEVPPALNLKEFVPLDTSLSNLSASVSKNETEKEVAEKIVSETMKKVTIPGELDWGRTKIKFAMKGGEYGGQVYILLNGQFQYKFEYLPKCELACLVETTARPIDEDYPMDPGREALRSPFKEEVLKLVSSMKQILEMIASHNLFKDGLDIKVYNKDQKPISTYEEESEAEIEQKKAEMMRDVQEAYDSSQQEFFDKEERAKEEKRKQEQRAAEEAERTGQPPPKPPEKTPEEIEKEKERLEEEERRRVAEALKKSTRVTGEDELHSAMIDAAVSTMDKSKDTKKELARIIESVSSPMAIIIQKNFTSQEVVDNNPSLMKSLAVLWHSVLSRTIKKSSRLYGNRSKTVIPGLIFSDECVAVYVPPDVQGKPHIIALNPLIVTALVDPESLSGKHEDIYLSPKKEVVENTPKDAEISMVDKLANMLHHTAIHEVTHFMFPDSFNSDQFHAYVTRLESICHFLYWETKDDVKRYIRGFKGENKKLMKLIHGYRTPKDLPGGRRSSQVLAEADMKAIYDAFLTGIPYNKLEQQFNLAPANGMNAYRVVQKYKKMKGLASNTRDWIRQQSGMTTKHWLRQICKLD